MMRNKYDLIIIGMGPSSIFCAYELLKLNSDKNILLIEKGKKIENRNCPMKKTETCLRCKPICNNIGGFGGAGTFSDGKLLSYHLSSYNKTGNNMYIGGKDDTFIKKYFTKQQISSVMKYTDDIYLEFGADNKLEGIDNLKEIDKYKSLALKNSIDLIDVPVRHIGTEKLHEIFKKMEDYLDGQIDLLFETEVVDLLIEDNEIYGVKLHNNNIVESDKVVLAVGMDGSNWLEKLSNKYNIKSRNGYIDIGVRYELKDSVMKNINSLLYEGKFIYKSKLYKDKIRTYCQNPSGFVTPETYDNGCSLVNGHSYKLKKSNNTNLALLISYKLKPPFKNPIDYYFNIAKNANLLSGGVAIVQRYGDLIRGLKTTKSKISKNSVIPTYTLAYPFDLSYVLDYRTLNNLIEFIEKLNNVIPGFNNPDNLMYGPEIKFYAKELLLDKNFMTSVNGLFSIGACGGLTIGLMNASLSGILFARRLENKI